MLYYYDEHENKKELTVKSMLEMMGISEDEFISGFIAVRGLAKERKLIRSLIISNTLFDQPEIDDMNHEYGTDLYKLLDRYKKSAIRRRY